MDPSNSINALERSLRDVIEFALRQVYGDSWLDRLGVAQERVDHWTALRQEESKRRPGGTVEQRLLYYSEFYDLLTIVRKNWDRVFKDCFQDKKRFDVYTDRLSAFRNPDAHSRDLLPFEEHLIVGMTGELRQEITLFLSSGAGGAEPEYFARIEEIRDSFGTRVIGEAAGGGLAYSPAVLRPGDRIEFVARGWDPDAKALTWEIHLGARHEFMQEYGAQIEWEWVIDERDIAEKSSILFHISQPQRAYARQGDNTDDVAALIYQVLPVRG